jgi:hypothetical protein
MRLPQAKGKRLRHYRWAERLNRSGRARFKKGGTAGEDRGCHGENKFWSYFPKLAIAAASVG